ncbi:hypothetical protein GJAV_G00272320 [Gymnothorax javanicus]|nr:hypothetical protein GJAV_G00272320 [Gymnothorax javanicus]
MCERDWKGAAGGLTASQFGTDPSIHGQVRCRVPGFKLCRHGCAGAEGVREAAEDWSFPARQDRGRLGRRECLVREAASEQEYTITAAETSGPTSQTSAAVGGPWRVRSGRNSSRLLSTGCIMYRPGNPLLPT